MRVVLAIFLKDIRLMLADCGNLLESLLLGLLLIFIFSLAQAPGKVCDTHEAAAIFWLASVFCQLLIFNQLYAIEEVNLSRVGLLLASEFPQAIWIGKALAGFVLLLLAQIFFFPGLMIFLGQEVYGDAARLIGAIFLTDIGLAIVGALLGATPQGNGARSSLVTILVFPLLIPLLLAGIGLLQASLSKESSGELWDWWGIGIAFDAIFIGAGIFLFGFVYQGED